MAELDPDAMTTPQAAEHLGLSAGTLQNMRSDGTGPAFRTQAGKPGRPRVVYRKADLDAWMHAATCPTCGSWRPHVLAEKAKESA